MSNPRNPLEIRAEHEAHLQFEEEFRDLEKRDRISNVLGWIVYPVIGVMFYWLMENFTDRWGWVITLTISLIGICMFAGAVIRKEEQC